jgi:cell division initiation protein
MPPPTPLDVEHKEFARAVRGYAMDEVDAFLDEVVKELTRMQDEITRLQDHARTNEEAIARALIQAQQMADKTVEEAKAKAQAIVAQAEADARRRTEAAKLRAHEITDAAELRARQREERVTESQKELERAIKALRAFERDYRGRLRGFVEAQLKALEEAAPTGPIAPPAPPGLSPIAE